MEYSCSLPTDSGDAKEALQGIRTIAVVGLSPKTERPSYQVSRYMQQHGFKIIPIRPGCTELLGEPVYPSLKDYKQPVDMVAIFRRSEAVPEIVDQAIAMRCNVIWMQEGIAHNSAAEKAEKAGIKVVQNRCLLKVHQAL